MKQIYAVRQVGQPPYRKIVIGRLVFHRESIVDFWLSEFDESTLEEAERLNVLLPLIKWCIEHGVMTDNLEGELALYYKDYTNGKLEDILADYEAKEVIADLVWCYQTHFAKK